MKLVSLPPDWVSLLSLVFGVFGLMLRSKTCSWAALLLCGSAVSNVKVSELDLKQLCCTGTFATLSLVVNYAV